MIPLFLIIGAGALSMATDILCTYTADLTGITEELRRSIWKVTVLIRARATEGDTAAVRVLVPVLVRVPVAAVQDAARRIRIRQEKLTSSFVEEYQK